MKKAILKLIILAIIYVLMDTGLITFKACAMNADLREGLVAYYTFDNNANDQSSFNNHGSISGATFTEDRLGIDGKALYFDGINDYVQIEDSPSLHDFSAITMSAWIYFHDSGIGSHMFLTKTMSYSLKILSYSEDVVVAGLNFENRTAAGFDCFRIQPYTWNLISFVYDSGKYASYLNDQMMTSGDTYDSEIKISDEPLYIGASLWDQIFFKGIIDDVRIYDRALTAEEVGQLYTIPEPTTLALLALGAMLAGRRKRV